VRSKNSCSPWLCLFIVLKSRISPIFQKTVGSQKKKMWLRILTVFCFYFKDTAGPRAVAAWLHYGLLTSRENLPTALLSSPLYLAPLGWNCLHVSALLTVGINLFLHIFFI
jgi:hypothetical protein